MVHVSEGLKCHRKSTDAQPTDPASMLRIVASRSKTKTARYAGMTSIGESVRMAKTSAGVGKDIYTMMAGCVQ